MIDITRRTKIKCLFLVVFTNTKKNQNRILTMAHLPACSVWHNICTLEDLMAAISDAAGWYITSTR